jgi:hypothetical protein
MIGAENSHFGSQKNDENTTYWLKAQWSPLEPSGARSSGLCVIGSDLSILSITKQTPYES